MEAQMARAPEQDLPDHLTDHQMAVVEGEGEHAHDHDHEKKSVLKKVKDKAKMIKHNLTSNMHHGGHGDDQYHPHAPHVDEDDIEEYDKEEVIVAKLQIHEVPDNVEAQVGPLVDDLGALKVSDESGPTGSLNQFAPYSENAPYNDSRNMTAPAPAVAPRENSLASYSEKISTATTAIAGTAVSAKDAIAEKLGYDSKDGHGQQIKAGPVWTTSAVGKIKEALAPVYEKVSGLGTAVASKISRKVAGKEATVGGPSNNSLSGKLRPGDEDRALCEVISNVLRRKNDEAEEAVEPETAKQAGELSGDGGTARSGSRNIVDRIKVAVTSLFVKGGNGGAGHGHPQEDGMEKREEGRLDQDEMNKLK